MSASAAVKDGNIAQAFLFAQVPAQKTPVNVFPAYARPNTQRFFRQFQVGARWRSGRCQRRGPK
eukprot:9128100-Lingulodinium_polyedra.AAC.1